MKLRLILIVLSFAFIGTVSSQTVLRSASSDELIEKLNPNPPKTRGLRNLTPEVREKPTVDLSIQFAFVVEGHTDGIGLPAYNLRLSDQRASAVLNYLSLSGGVTKNRLKSVGKGSNDLLMPDKPDAAENRRVRITLNS